MRRLVLIAVALLLAGTVRTAAQDSGAAAPQAGAPVPTIEERVEVVGVTPIHGIGLPVSKVPANVQVFTSADLVPDSPPDVARLLARRATSVQTSDVQGGAFQPDVLFRGFVASPLLGASEGIAVYQDGVRINDPFGDTVHWDTLPGIAVASINLMPGSNPLFGLNALGGAVSIRTKDGFDAEGRRASFTTGSFGRHRLEAEAGGHGRAFGYYVAGSLAAEEGWRDFSPSTLRSVFGNLAWRGAASAVNVGITAASNDLTGNGTAPADLLRSDRRAVFTHPDRTGNDSALLTAQGRRQWSARAFVEGVAYFRHHRSATFNGDAADDDLEDAEEEGEEHENGIEAVDLDHTVAENAFDAVNNRSRTRGRAAGLLAQLTWLAAPGGRENQLIAGGGLDAASTTFAFEAEHARLTPERGTTGSGVVDPDAAVDLRSRILTGSAFLTNTWSLTGALGITAGARANWTSLRLRDRIGTALTGDHRFFRVNPAVGVTYQAHRRVNLFAGYAQSSRVPTPVELTCADPEDPCRLPNAFVSDPPLQQIVASTWEAGARSMARPLRWSVAAFRTTSADDIIFVSSGTLRGEGHFENVPRTRRRGVEAAIGYDSGRLSVFGAYTVQRAAFETDLRIASPFHPDARGGEIVVPWGSRLPGVPAHVAKAGVSAAVMDALRVGIDLRAQSGQFLRGDEANRLPPIPGFAVVDARAEHRLASQVALVAHLHNMFDRRFYTFAALGDAEEVLGEGFDDPRFYSPGAPRAAWIGVEVRF